MLPIDIDTGCNRSQGGSHGSDPTIGNCCAAMIAPPFSLAASAMDQVTVGYSACCSGEKICLELKAIDPGRVRPQQLLAIAGSDQGSAGSSIAPISANQGDRC